MTEVFIPFNMGIKDVKPSKGRPYNQGYYRLINESKYVGEHPIIYRSSWERKFCIYCDKKAEIIKWSSEPLGIKYINPLSNKESIYYPDFYMEVLQKDNTVKKFLVEIKPKSHLQKPKKPKLNRTSSIKSFKYLANEYMKNVVKIKAGKEYAKSKGWDFIVITEDSI